MTNNLKIEVLVSNIPEDGSIASQFPSQEYVNQQLAKKANLSTEGRLDPSHAPDYTEIPGLYEHIEDTKDAIETSIADSLQDAKGYTNQQLSTSLQTKADLVNGKIPFDQIPFSADIEDQIQINVENITAVVDQKVAQVVEQVNGVATAANSYTDTKVAENKTYVDTTFGSVIEDVTTIVDTKVVSKEFTIPTYLTPEAGVAVGTGVKSGAYFNVRSTDDNTMLVEYQNVAGNAEATGKNYPSTALVNSLKDYIVMPFKEGKLYSLYERVQLENGSIVRNDVMNNTTDPNVNMTGWTLTTSDGQIKTWSGRTQESKNRDFVTDKDYGAIGDGTYHPLSEKYSTLALAKFAYENIAEKITSLDQSIDWAAAQSAITVNSRVYLSDGHRVITDTIIIPDNHGFYSASKPRSVGTTEFSKYKTAFLFYGTGAKNYIISDITDADHQTANPDAGADYLADSGTRGNVYKLRNYNELFSVGIDLGDGSYLDNIAVIPYYDGVSGYADSGRKDSAHKWDVGILCANANHWELKSVHSVGQWRKTGCLVASSAQAHPTRNPSSEGWLISNSRFQGGAGLSIRSEDLAATSTNNGFGSATIFNSWAIGFEHQSMHLATSDWFDAPLDRPSACLEIHGKTMRGIDFISSTLLSREDISIFGGNCGEIKFSLCYQEAKNIRINGTWASNKYGARNLLKPVTGIQFYQHSKYAIDCSPNYPRESSVSRYSASAGVWENNSAIDDDYEAVRYINSFGFRLRRSSDKFAINNTSNSNIHTVDDAGNVVSSGKTTSSGFQSNKEIVLTGSGLDSRLINTVSNSDMSFWVSVGGTWYPSFRAVGLTGDLQLHQNLVVATNNTQSIGEAARVVKDIHLGAAPIVSSDERLKQQFRSVSELEKDAALEIKASICLYKFNDSVDLKGDGARWHVGVKAQQIVAIMQSHNLDPFEYGFVCFDEWDEQDEIVETWDDEFDESGELVREAGSHVTQEYRPAGSRYAIRYDELSMFILAAL